MILQNDFHLACLVAVVLPFEEGKCVTQRERRLRLKSLPMEIESIEDHSRKLIMIKCFCYWLGNPIFSSCGSIFPLCSNQQRRPLDFPLVIAWELLPRSFPRQNQILWWISFFMLGLYVNWMSIYIFPITAICSSSWALTLESGTRKGFSRETRERDCVSSPNWGTDSRSKQQSYYFCRKQCNATSLFPRPLLMRWNSEHATLFARSKFVFLGMPSHFITFLLIDFCSLFPCEFKVKVFSQEEMDLLLLLLLMAHKR